MSSNRRTFLRAAGVAGLSAAATSYATPAHARQLPGSVTFVLVHTGYASAAWWDGVARELVLRGHRAFAVDLPGHGPDAYYPRSYQTQDLSVLRTEPSPAAELTVDGYAATVRRAVERAAEGGPVIVAAHGDAGAAAATRVANSMADSLQHLIYIDAYLCVDRPTIGEYLELPENGDALLAPVVKTPPDLGIARVNWRSGNREELDAYYAALAEGMARDRFRAVLNSLSPDIGVELWGADLRVKAETWGRIPRTYVRFTKDRTIPVALQDRMIAEADDLTPSNPFRVRSVPLPHVGPLDDSRIIDVLDKVAESVSWW